VALADPARHVPRRVGIVFDARPSAPWCRRRSGGAREEAGSGVSVLGEDIRLGARCCRRLGDRSGRGGDEGPASDAVHRAEPDPWRLRPRPVVLAMVNPPRRRRGGRRSVDRCFPACRRGGPVADRLPHLVPPLRQRRSERRHRGHTAAHGSTAGAGRTSPTLNGPRGCCVGDSPKSHHGPATGAGADPVRPARRRAGLDGPRAAGCHRGLYSASDRPADCDATARSSRAGTSVPGRRPSSRCLGRSECPETVDSRWPSHLAAVKRPHSDVRDVQGPLSTWGRRGRLGWTRRRCHRSC